MIDAVTGKVVECADCPKVNRCSYCSEVNRCDCDEVIDAVTVVR